MPALEPATATATGHALPPKYAIAAANIPDAANQIPYSNIHACFAVSMVPK